MVKDKSIAIIGSGIAGLSLAYRLKKEGFNNVWLVAPRDQRPGSASHAAQGNVGIKGLGFAREPFFEAKLLGSRAFYTYLTELESESGVRIPRGLGVSEPFSTPEEYQKILRRVFHSEFLGASAVEIKKSEIFYYEDAFVHVPSLLKALTEASARLGVRHSLGEVRFLKPREQGIELVFKGSRAPERFDTVVLAAGVFCQEILSQSALGPVPMDRGVGGRVYVKKVGPGQFAKILGKRSLVRIHAEERWGAFDDSDQEEERGPGSDFLGEADQTLWGVRSKSPDRMPILGKYSPLKGLESPGELWLFYGFYRNGLTLADPCAKALVQLMKGGGAPLEKPWNLFLWERFARNYKGGLEVKAQE